MEDHIPELDRTRGEFIEVFFEPDGIEFLAGDLNLKVGQTVRGQPQIGPRHERPSRFRGRFVGYQIHHLGDFLFRIGHFNI